MSHAHDPAIEREIQVRLFGAFRDLVPSGKYTLRVHAEASVGGIKNALAHELHSRANAKFDVTELMAKSVLATETRVLSDDEIFSGSNIAILPPVCGG